MWISNDTKVGNTSDSDSDNETWNDDVYGSIKVSVRGDFNEKELAYEDKYNVTDASCFETEEVTAFEVNHAMKEQSMEDVNELTACTLLNYQNEFAEGSDAESYCRGTGTTWDGMTIQEYFNNWQEDAINYDFDFLESGGQTMLDLGIIIPDNDTYIVNPIMLNQTVEDTNELTTCALYFFYEKFDLVLSESFCKGTETVNGETIDELAINNILGGGLLLTFPRDLNFVSMQNGVNISNYNETCGSDVVIPKTINGNSILGIDFESFIQKQLTSVVIPNNVMAIGEMAFAYNQLTKVIIPNSVMEVRNSAFYENQLTNVTFEEKSKLQKIDGGAFAGYNHTIDTVTIPDSVIYLACHAFNEDVTIIKNENLVCRGGGPV